MSRSQTDNIMALCPPFYIDDAVVSTIIYSICFRKLNCKFQITGNKAVTLPYSQISIVTLFSEWGFPDLSFPLEYWAPESQAVWGAPVERGNAPKSQAAALV